MKSFWRSQILVLAITLSTISYGAIAQPEESKQSQPPPELSSLEYFEGTCRCQQPAAPASPSGIFTWTVRLDLNDFWYLGNAEETQSPNEGKPVNSREFLGYNAASQKLVRSVVVGNGNSYNLTASDWQDGKLVWEGTITRMGESIPLRQEIIQDSADKFTATYFIPDDPGNWKPVVNETCPRS
ncbi:MAG: hypothetical protein QNJ32_10895 [Xenococcaceae cyanobacterium MO_167.B27]|nr:hypothetical protein [Xenococcaceae cyanobacterium MO_167.B27]